MFIEDREGNFHAFAIVPNADYSDGIFTIEFNERIKEHIYGLTGNYTTYELSVLTNFSKNSSLRLYEVLKKDLYKCGRGDNNGTLELEYGLSELKFMIGVANSDDQLIKNEMARMGNNIDWDKLYNMLATKDKKYERWGHFRERILLPAQQEMEEKSDIRFDFEGIRVGHSVGRVLFKISKNNPQNSEKIAQNQKILEKNVDKRPIFEQTKLPRSAYQALYEDFVGHNGMSEADIDVLLQKSGWNETRVRETITLADKQDHLESYMGWMVRCIENGYTQTETVEGSAEKATKVRLVMESYEDNKDATFLRLWEKAKSNADFADFTLAMGCKSPEDFELFYEDPNEAYELYVNWKKEQKGLK